MLALTEDVEAALAWFWMTHRLTEQGWELVTLPHAGGLADQDARLLDTLQTVRSIANEVYLESIVLRQGRS